MKTLFLHIPHHSIVDLITNSSSELFVFKGEPRDETAKLLLEVLTTHGFNESSVSKFADYKFKDDIELPEGINADDIYVANFDYSDQALETLVREVFEEIEVVWK